jgi:hypothetical protein
MIIASQPQSSSSAACIAANGLDGAKLAEEIAASMIAQLAAGAIAITDLQVLAKSTDGGSACAAPITIDMEELKSRNQHGMLFSASKSALLTRRPQYHFIKAISTSVHQPQQRVGVHNTIERQPAVEVQPTAQTAVGLATCNVDAVPQRWMVDNINHRVKLAGSQLCLALSKADSTALELQHCSDGIAPEQQWLMVGPSGSSALVATATSHCAAMVGVPSLLDSQQHWLGLVATDCSPAMAQSWRAFPDGSIRPSADRKSCISPVKHLAVDAVAFVMEPVAKPVAGRHPTKSSGAPSRTLVTLLVLNRAAAAQPFGLIDAATGMKVTDLSIAPHTMQIITYDSTELFNDAAPGWGKTIVAILLLTSAIGVLASPQGREHLQHAKEQLGDRLEALGATFNRRSVAEEFPGFSKAGNVEMQGLMDPADDEPVAPDMSRFLH